MNGLLYKDLLNLRSTFKMYLAFLIIFGVIFIPSGNPLAVYILVIMFGVTIPMTALSFDAAAKWDRYALTMPVTRNGIVRTKYQIMLMLTGLGVGITAVLTGIINRISPGHLTFGIIDPVSLLLFLLTTGLLIGSIVLPAAYKFGVEKARYIAIIGALGPMILVVGLLTLVDVSQGSLDAVLLNTVLGIAVGIAAAVVWISYRTSVRIYAAQEF